MEQNLNLYQIFYTVALAGNISQASKELYVSQPAISKSISKLEANLNAKLFTRTSRGVKLTEEGQLLFEHVDKGFKAIHLGEDKLSKMQNLGIGHISIGVSNTLCKYVLLPFLKEFIQKNPHIKTSIICQSTAKTLNALEEGTIDIGLIGEPINFEHYFQPIMEIQDEFVTTKSYLKHLSERVPLNKSSILAHGDFWLLDKQNITRQYIDICLQENNIELGQVLEASSMDLLIEFAKIDLGITCVISNFIADELENGELIRLPFSITIPKRMIGFAWNIKNESKALQKFTQLIKNETHQ